MKNKQAKINSYLIAKNSIIVYMYIVHITNKKVIKGTVTYSK